MNDSNNNFLKIKSSRLEVEMLKPGTVYKRSRFDWTSFITQVKLDGCNTFCTSESLKENEGSGGAGFCNEFGIRMPIGYDEILPGEEFIKIGVGLIKKESNEPYNFFKDYTVKSFSTSYEQPDESRICFYVEPIECNGYAVSLEKRVSVEGNLLKIGYKLTNTGSKKIVTNEYCHNFISINGNPTGKDYVLSFSNKIELKNPVGHILKSNDNEIRWDICPESDFYAGIEVLNNTVNPFIWKLVHVHSNLSIQENSKFNDYTVAIWGKGHVISPEVFVPININPGEIQEWQREYEFNC